MWIHVEITSADLRVYDDNQSHDAGDDYHFICRISPKFDDHEGVVISGGFGSLSNEINIKIGLKLYEMGYKNIYFSTTVGKTPTRYAEFISTDGTLNYWRVNIPGVIARYDLR